MVAGPISFPLPSPHLTIVILQFRFRLAVARPSLMNAADRFRNGQYFIRIAPSAEAQPKIKANPAPTTLSPEISLASDSTDSDIRNLP
jgi:hypothetical protein